jgi:hypothetical protein
MDLAILAHHSIPGSVNFGNIRKVGVREVIIYMRTARGKEVSCMRS